MLQHTRLGDYESQHNTKESLYAAFLAMQEDLKALEQKIEARNKQLKIPYTYMCPSKINNTI